MCCRRGICSGRYSNYKKACKGQITFFASDVIEDICRAPGAGTLSRGVTRRNVIAEGVDLNLLAGKRFTLQNLEFNGVCDCKPCYWMDRAIALVAEAVLHGRGGLQEKILKD